MPADDQPFAMVVVSMDDVRFLLWALDTVRHEREDMTLYRRLLAAYPQWHPAALPESEIGN